MLSHTTMSAMRWLRGRQLTQSIHNVVFGFVCVCLFGTYAYTVSVHGIQQHNQELLLLYFLELKEADWCAFDSTIE